MESDKVKYFLRTWTLFAAASKARCGPFSFARATLGIDMRVRTSPRLSPAGCRWPSGARRALGPRRPAEGVDGDARADWALDSSCAGESSERPANLTLGRGGLHDFHAPEPGLLIVAAPPPAAPAVRNDRGVRCRLASWAAICERHGLFRGISRKVMSCDNTRAEGFFGLLKQEFFHPRNWRGVGLAEFVSGLDAWMRRFRSGRISRALGRLTPDERRLVLGYAVWVQDNFRSPDVHENVRSPNPAEMRKKYNI